MRLTALLVLAASVIAFLLGWSLAPTRVAPGTEAPAAMLVGGSAAPVDAPAASRPTSGAEPLRRRVVELERQVRALALLAAVAPAAARSAEALPPPQPFPAGLPAEVGPERFKQAAAEALQGCFPALQVQDAECSEYPCIAWSSYDAAKGGHFDFSACEGWSARMGQETVVHGFTSEDGKTAFFGLASLPTDPAQRKVAVARMRARMTSLGEAYGIRAP